MTTPRHRLALAALALLLFASSSIAAPTSPVASKSAAPASATGTTPGRPKATTMRAIGSLPALSSFGRLSGPLTGSFFSTTDTFVVQSHGFQDLDGTCQARGWAATDRTSQVFAHVSGRYVVNHSAFIGRRFDGSGIPTFPAALTRGLVVPTEVALNDSGRVVYTEGALAGLMVIETYPAANLARQIASDAVGIAFTRGMIVDPITHGLLISYTNLSQIFLIPSGGGTPVHFAGADFSSGVENDTTVAAARIEADGLATDSNGNVYFAEASTSRIRMIRRNDMRVVTVAGDGNVGYSGDGGPALSAHLANPVGLALNPTGTELFFCDLENNRVRRVDLTTGIITTIAGGPGVFFGPHAIAYSGGALYVTAVDPADFTRMYKIVGGTVSVAVGNRDFFGPPSGSNLGQQLLFRNTSFNTASRLASDNAGGCYFAANRLIYHLHGDGQLDVVAGDRVSFLMGAKALWFGADSTSAPDEVEHWVSRSGHGNGWSQRLTSPAFDRGAHPNARLEFDMALSFNTTMLQPATSNRLVEVEGQRADGVWVPLAAQYQNGALGDVSGTGVVGIDVVHVVVDLASGSNDSANLGTTTRLRVLVQTEDTGSAEDGDPSSRPAGAAVVDNLTLRDGVSNVLAPLDFEDGTTGLWTLSAQNGAYPITEGGMSRRDLPGLVTTGALRTNFDLSDPSCAWTFLAANDTVAPGVFTQLVSPWIRLPDKSATTLITFSGKLPDNLTGVFVTPFVRGKLAGAMHPHFDAQSWFTLNSGIGVSDATVPFFNQAVLRYPDDFQVLYGTLAPDSIQLVFSIEDRREQAFYGSIYMPSMHATRLPFLDDIRLYQLGVDSDFDGVADSQDACPSVLAAGQDADGNGCLDPTATFHHVETWASSSLPLRYRISLQRIPGITDFSDRAAFLAAVNAWKNVPGAKVRINADPDTPQVAASATDGINLITFQDQTFAFSPSVLAVTPTLSATRRTWFGDDIVLPGQIVDADIVFNPTASFRTPTHAGAFDLQSVATHELGHLLGLSHSGVATATMYFVQQPGTIAATLKDDDMAAIAAAYPETTLATGFGSIKGTVMRDTTGLPIPGALVTAVHLDVSGAVIDTAGSDYTREDGSYAMYRVPAGNYAVYVTPLDGLILNGLSPEFISGHLAAIAQSNFDPEWYSAIESAHDDPALRQTLTLGAGTALTGINVITNLDTIPPVIVATSPANASSGSAIDASVLVTFSEPVDIPSLQSAFKLRAQGTVPRLAGSGLLSNAGRTFLFTPTNALDFDSPYEIVFTTDLTDATGVHLPSEFTATFRTQVRPPVSITQISPRSVRPGAIVTLTGAGFQPGGGDFIIFERFTSDTAVIVGRSSATAISYDSTVTVSHSPTSLTFVVPARSPGLDSVYVMSGGEISNKLAMTVLAPVPQASPSPSGIPVPLAFSPTDVALAPDGLSAVAVGEGGLATINLNPQLPSLRVAVQRFTQAAKSIALNPDGTRGFVTQPLGSDILVVDTSPTSVGLGTVLDTIFVPGQPRAIVMDPAGRRAYAIETATGVVFEMDVNPASTSANSLIRQFPPLGPLTGGLEMDPRGDRLYLTNALEIITLTLKDSTTSVQSSGFRVSLGGAIAIDPSATQLIFPVSSQVRLTSPSNSFPTEGAVLGGTPVNVLVSPQGQSAFVANQLFNQLQVVNVDRSSPTYHTTVAQIATGAGPVAIASNNDGSLLAVANSGGHSISLFNVLTAGVPIMQRVVPDVALPGDAVAIQSPNSTVLTATSQVDLGSGLLGLTNAIAGGGAFAVPPLTQRTTSVTVQQASGARSTSLPFSIVDRITTFAPHSTSVSRVPGAISCGPGFMYGRLDMVRVSPDGSTIALARQSASPCNSIIDFYEASDHGPGVLGDFIGQSGLPMSIIRDMAFTPDGRRLWFIGEDLTSGILDTDRSSLAFGSQVGAFGPPSVPSPAQFAADPLGRFVFASDLSAGRVMFLNPGTAGVTSIIPLTTPTRGLAVSPDGRTLVVGLNGRASFVNIATLSIVLFSPNHVAAGVADYFQRIAITTDGKRAVGLMDTGRIAVWNLDPAQSVIGTELFFGTPIPVALSPSSPVAGSDGHSVIFGCANSDSMVRMDVGSGTPIVTYALIGQRSAAVGRSPDGRRLWVARNFTPGSTGPGNVSAFSLSPATHLSLVGGGDQSAPANSTLPLPIDVRVTDDFGRPQQGVAIHFVTDGVTNGTLDGVSGRISTYHLTDSNGEAVVSWKLPAFGSSVSLGVTAEGVTGGTLTAHATLAVDDSQIEPVIVGLGPPNGAAGLNAGTAVFARFNQRMEASSAASHLRLFMNGAPVTGTPSLSEQGRLVLFQPGTALQFSARCSLVVDAGMLDLDGQSLAQGGVSVFTVQAPPPVALNSLMPQAGPAGTAVVLNGTGFSATPAQNVVLFSGVLALPSDARLTSLVANAPLAAPSGPVTVGVGNATSNALTFTVLPPNPNPGGVLGELNASQGIRDVAASPDGSRLYVTNPGSSTLTALDVNTATKLTDITVGSLPQSVAILPDGSRAYVANTGSNNLSVVDVKPSSATYHTVLKTIPVGSMPVDVQIGPVGPKIYVLNQGSNTLDEIDANPGNATFDQVVTTVSTGSGGKNIAITPDGTRAYVAVGAGLLVIDLMSHQVVTTVSTGSGGKNIAITPDGTLALLLTESGELIVIDVAPGPSQYRVVTTASTGSGGKNVAITPDGTLAYITNETDNTVLVFSIGHASSGGSSVLPGPAVRLTRVATFPTGQGPGGIAIDPTGKTLVYVANEGSGTVSVFGFPGGLPTVPVTFGFNPNSLNLKSMGKWVKGTIRPPAPYTASDIVLSSVRLNGVVPVDTTGPHSIDDSNSELSVSFVRSEVQMVVGTGDAVPVTVTGLIEGRNFSGQDTIKVSRGKVTAPNVGQVLASHSTFNVTWTTPNGTNVQWVAILHSFDHGNNWTLDAQNLPNTGSYSWTVPNASTDSAKVAVVLVESTLPTSADSLGAQSSEVSGPLAISDYFRIRGTTDLTPPPVTLEFSSIRPNPARGTAVLRFGLPRRTKIDLELFDLQGRRTRVLMSGVHEPGWYDVRWNGQTDGGGGAAAGLYFARFRAEGREFKQRLIWLR